MNNQINRSAPISALNQAKEAKEFVNNLNKTVNKEPDRSECGLENPCCFGERNKNFNKHCL